MKKSILTLALVILGSLLSDVAYSAVWVEENAWSSSWEAKYAEWLKLNAGPKMFALEKRANNEPNPYYGIRVDCADLVYSLRIIFSFENKLPFTMTNPVGRGISVISNQITRFDAAEEGVPRLRKFLTWIYDLVSTHGLPRDTYSVGFDQIGPGTIILTTRKNHHSWTIKEISKAGNPSLIFNSTNARTSGLTVQERQSWPNPAWIFEPEIDKNDATKNISVYFPGSYPGFRHWRPAEYLNQDEKTIPGYSDEQFKVGINKWKAMAMSSLAKVQESIDQVVMRLLNDACADLKQRVEAVESAERYKVALAADFAAGKSENESKFIKDFMSDSDRPSDKRCLTAKTFDEFSTPSRDKRLIDAIVLARAYFSYGVRNFGTKAFSAANLETYNAIFPFNQESASAEAKKDEGAASSFCKMSVPVVGTLSLAQFKRRIFLNRFSSNPNDSYSVRFGGSKTSKDLGDTCPAYDLTKKSLNLDAIEKEMENEVNASPVSH